MKLYDAGLGILIFLLIGFIAFSGNKADSGNAINCKSNPEHAKCVYNLNK